MEHFLKNQGDLVKSSDGTYEWSFKYQTDYPWSSEIFDNVILYLKSDDDYVEKINPDTLVVTMMENGAQLQVKEVANISRFCVSDSPKLVPHEWHQIKSINSELLPDELPIAVISQIVERSVIKNDAEKFTKEWDTSMKHYRLIKEFTYTGKNVCYKISIVRDSSNPYMTMNESAVSYAQVNYEFEAIITGNYDNSVEIIHNCVRMIQLIMGQMNPLAKQQQSNIIAEYYALLKTILKDANTYKRREDVPFFFAPKPITLELENLVEPSAESYGVQSIYSGYAVTDKADGERMLLYISKTGNGYLINNTLDVFDTGLRVTSDALTDTLLDGEFINMQIRRDGNSNHLFTAFDIYFMKGKSMVDLPLIARLPDKPSRNEMMLQVCKEGMWAPRGAAKNSANLQIRAKTHVFAEGKSLMNDACRALLQNANGLAYNIDGLIFTPAELSVYGFYPGRPAKITDNVRWDKVMKWKPPEQNSIDFLVEEGDVVTDPITNRKYKEFKLFTGYNAVQWEPITVAEGIRLRYEKGYMDSRRMIVDSYRPKLFRPIDMPADISVAHIPISENGLVQCEDGSIVESKSIVEFTYRKNQLGAGGGAGDVSKKWFALRTRGDKTRIYQKTGKISKTANDLAVATSIWRTINKPVSSDIITGVEPVLSSALPIEIEERLLGSEDVYYARSIPRDHRLSVHMLNFHNHGIKKRLYDMGKKEALLELACGMAGDLSRWRASGYHFILGVDLVKDNITNSKEGAYAILLKQNKAVKVDGIMDPIFPDTIFVVGDCAVQLNNGKAAEGIDDDSRSVLRALFKNTKPARYNPKWEQKRADIIPPQLVGKASAGFTVVSAMFSIHYFFKTEDTLNGFFRNVADNLRRGGIFITTFMDGNNVHELLKKSAAGVVDGRKLDAQVPVWAIIRRYTKFEDGQRYGKTVDVFIENTNRLIPEYLVHYETLVAKAQQFDLVVDKTAFFSEDFAALRAGIPADPTKRSRLDSDILELDKDPIQTQFSFLNRWVVFKKI